MASSPSNFILDADLHGLVDGRLERSRRAEVLRRLGQAPDERARAESWQRQNEWLRTAFADVDREPLPLGLNLRARPRLQCVSTADAVRPDPVQGAARPKARRRVGWGVVGILVTAAVVAACWLILNLGESETPTGRAMMGALETVLAGRAAEGVGFAGGEEERPLIEIPDLRKAGFTLTGAALDGGEPGVFVARYRGAAAGQIALSMSRAASQDADLAPTRVGDAYVWRRAGLTFALAGTLPSARLHALALSLQRGEESRPGR